MGDRSIIKYFSIQNFGLSPRAFLNLLIPLTSSLTFLGKKPKQTIIQYFLAHHPPSVPHSCGVPYFRIGVCF